MPGAKPGKAESLLSEQQLRELVEWADATPGGANGPALHDKLKQMGIACGLGAAYTLKRSRIDPALENLSIIASSAKFATQAGEAMAGTDQSQVAKAANLVQQKAVFDWALKHQRQGTLDLDNPEFAELFIEFQKVTSRGLLADDRKALTDVRVETLQVKLAKMEVEREAERKAALATLVDVKLTDAEKKQKMHRIFGMAASLVIACFVTFTFTPMATARQRVDNLRQKLEAGNQTGDALAGLPAETEADRELRRKVAESLNWPDVTQSMSDEELETAALAHVHGTNINKWVNPFDDTNPFSLLKEHQYRAAMRGDRFAADLWGRQTGKDFSGQAGVVRDCLMNPGIRWMTAAPSERQSLQSLDKAKEWAEAFDLHIADYNEIREGLGGQTMLKSAEITWSNGSKETAVPGKPDTVRGDSASILLTEFDFFENPLGTWRAILPSITNPMRGGEKKVRVKTTPNGIGSAMYDIMFRDDKKKKLKWARSIVTVYHAVLYGLPIDWEELREAFEGDPEGFMQECLCKFLDKSSVLLPYPLIASAESVLATMGATPEQLEAERLPLVMGIDFGRVSDPTVAITAQQSLGRLRVRDVKKFVNENTVAQVDFILPTAKLCDRICVDYTGPGIGFGDIMVNELGRWDPEHHEFGKVELCTFTPGLKRAIFPALKVIFDKLGIEIPIDIWLREDLHAMSQVISNGQYSYQAPRTALGHSDACTAMALLVRAAASASGPFEYQGIGSRNLAPNDPHDVFGGFQHDDETGLFLPS